MFHVDLHAQNVFDHMSREDLTVFQPFPTPSGRQRLSPVKFWIQRIGRGLPRLPFQLNNLLYWWRTFSPSSCSRWTESIPGHSPTSLSRPISTILSSYLRMNQVCLLYFRTLADAAGLFHLGEECLRCTMHFQPFSWAPSLWYSNKMSSISLWHLNTRPPIGDYLERTRFGLVQGGVSLWMYFEVSKASCQLLTALSASCLESKIWAPSSSLFQAFVSSFWKLILWNFCFVFYAALDVLNSLCRSSCPGTYHRDPPPLPLDSRPPPPHPATLWNLKPK